MWKLYCDNINYCLDFSHKRNAVMTFILINGYCANTMIVGNRCVFPRGENLIPAHAQATCLPTLVNNALKSLGKFRLKLTWCLRISACCLLNSFSLRGRQK